jgi:RNA polymerase sigma factor (sigma-70 family)
LNKHSKKSDLFKEPIRVEDELTLYASTWLQPLIDKLLSHPIAPPRWGPHKDRFIKALKERALSRGTNPKYELRRAARTAISLTLSGFSVPARLFDPNETDAPLARAFVRKDVRQRVNNLVTKDLLGTEWRRHDVSIDEEIPDSFDSDELIGILDNQERINKSLDALKELTDRQRQVIQLVDIEESTLEAAGKELGITKQTVDEIHKAALKKLFHKCRSLS